MSPITPTRAIPDRPEASDRSPSLLRQVAELLARAASGDPRDLSWPEPGAGEELELLVRSAQSLVERVVATEEREEELRDRRTELAEGFERVMNGIVESVAAAAAQLRATALNLSENARRTSADATTLMRSVEKTTQGIEHCASLTGEFSTAIHDIDQQVATSTQFSMAAVQAAEEAGVLVEGLAEATRRISSVLGMIQEVAEQTNLLALNATIEAARAGQAGKGFAVLASAVKNLSAQTREATTEIDDQVRGIQDATTSVVTSIELISETIAELSTVSQLIAEALSKQGAVTREMNEGAADTAKRAQSMNSGVRHVSEMAGETSKNCENMLGAATELSEMAGQLRAEVRRITSELREE